MRRLGQINPPQEGNARARRQAAWAARRGRDRAPHRDLITALDEASLSRFHLQAVLASGMGFFTDAYDLFIIGIAAALITRDWDLSTGQLALLNSTMLGAACLGAFAFGRFADVIGCKRACTG